MFEVKLNKELAKVWDSNPPPGDEWHKGLVASYLTNESEAFLPDDVEPLQTVTNWHDLPRDMNGWRKYFPCFYTKYTDRSNRVYFPISDFDEFDLFDAYYNYRNNTKTPGQSINSKIKDGVITFATLSAFTNSLRRGDHDNKTRNYGAWGFNAPAYLLEIKIGSGGMLAGKPLPAGFRVAR